MTLHTFGCSITQGFALPDTIRPITDQEEAALGRKFHWTDVHLYKPSALAWPQVLADRLAVPVVNHARRGACFTQISRQVAQSIRHIQPQDTVIIMWTYLSRLSLQWPARTAVPFCTQVDPNWGWSTRHMPGFNSLFGLTPRETDTERQDRIIMDHIRSYAELHLSDMAIFDQYYSNMILQIMTAHAVAGTHARVIHLSVEPESALRQLETIRCALDPSLREPWSIPDPAQWYSLDIDHDSCMIILDPSIPPAENDTHPSVQHHKNFADHIYRKYFAAASQP